MAFKTLLDIDDLNDLRVIDFSYNLSRDIDASGRPSGGVRGGTIDITIESTSDTKIFGWMVNNKTVDGTIKIEDDMNPGSNMKEIKFETAFITDYSENFHWQGSENIMQSFSVSAKKITVGGDSHENLWTS